jgi:hypothetical protein
MVLISLDQCTQHAVIDEGAGAAEFVHVGHGRLQIGELLPREHHLSGPACSAMHGRARISHRRNTWPATLPIDERTHSNVTSRALLTSA